MTCLSKLTRSITPYIPGEQPQDMQYVKINTNENPYGPSDAVKQIVSNYNCEKLKLYPDPNNSSLVKAICDKYDVLPENVFVGNGSDEVLALCFPTFFNPNEKPVAYADITYSFYKVWAKMFGIQSKIMPLDDNFRIKVEDYTALGDSVDGIILANPNAPTSIGLDQNSILRIVEANSDKVVIVDEAYVDFSNCTVLPYIKDHDNLLVVRTFSKSYSLAGARCGFAIGNKTLIDGLKSIKNSFNSYTVNRLTEEVAVAALKDEAYFEKCTEKVVAQRQKTADALMSLGFEVLDSKSNFLFAKHKTISGSELYFSLKEKGILVRHFKQTRIEDYLRITIGTDSDMNKLIAALKIIIK